MKTKSISVNEVEYTAHRLAIKFMTYNEPIPSFRFSFPEYLRELSKGSLPKF